MFKISSIPTPITDAFNTSIIKGLSVITFLTLPMLSNAQNNSITAPLLAVAESKPSLTEDNANNSSSITAVTVTPKWAQNSGEDLQGYLIRSLKYPATASLNDVAGEVKVRFTVNVDGSITNVAIIKGLNPEIESKVLEVVKAMPNWQPGLFNGKPVAMNYILPINFQLKHETIIPN